MADTTKILPKLRFPEFANDGKWDVVKLGEVVTFCNSKCNRSELRIDTYISTENIRQDFLGIKRAVNLPQNGSFTKFRIGDILVSNIRPYLKKIWQANFDGAASNDVLVFRTKNQNYDEYVAHLIKSDAFVNYCMEGAKGVKMPRGDKSTMLEYSIPLPSLPEQQKIASLLTSLDKQISANTKKLEALKAHKKSLMQQLFPANGEKTPKLRFPEFKNAGEWKSTTLGQITNVINRRNKSKRELPIYSISNKNGFILQNEQFDGLDSNKRGYDISMYKIVGKNTFAYNPARINIGSIGYSGNLSEIQISSLYVCFKTTEDADDSFLQYFFDSFKFNNAVESNVEGGIRSYLFYENFSKIRIDIPSLSEQKKIASCFNTINVNIKTNSEKINALEQQKIGLMQKLFPICFK